MQRLDLATQILAALRGTSAARPVSIGAIVIRCGNSHSHGTFRSHITQLVGEGKIDRQERWNGLVKFWVYWLKT